MQLLVAAARKETFARILDCPRYPAPARTPGLSEATDRLTTDLRSSEPGAAALLALLYESARPLTQRKRAGQFFTPRMSAQWAVDVARPLPADVIWDAGAGAGAFAEALVRRKVRVREYTGVENDPILALCAAHVLEAIDAPPSYKIWYANFLTLRRDLLEARSRLAPTLILSNPPFVRFHNLKGRGRMLSAIKASLGIELSPLSGTASYFLCRGVEISGGAQSLDALSRKRPRLLYFSPKEAVGSAHSRRLRADLQRSQGWSWRVLPVPNHAREVAEGRPNAAAVLFVFEKGRLRPVVAPISRAPQYALGDVMRVSRGISTGRNAFFVLTDVEARSRAIPERWLRRVLPTRITFSSDRFSTEDWERLRILGYPCWLLTLPSVEPRELDRAVQTYLKEGLRQGLHSTATARRLRTWFALPVPLDPPDVFVTYLFRGAPRFILNAARVLHLTNILGGRFRPPVASDEVKGQLVEKLNQEARSWMTDERPGREYRDGLRKIEPRELEHVAISASTVKVLGRVLAVTQLSGRTLFE